MATTSGAGVPNKSVISSSWCTTFLPGNSGRPSSTSAKMQPMLQMSMAGLYFAKKLPHSSGARYLQAGASDRLGWVGAAPRQAASHCSSGR